MPYAVWLALLSFWPRSDPFRFWPAKLKPWCFPYYHWLNHRHLYDKFHLKPVQFPEHGIEQIKALAKPGNHTLLVSNHVGYMDPHIYVELMFRHQFQFKWMAGIEPFEKGGGLHGWHIQGSGTFSLDRGGLDRRSLQYAQQVMDDGHYPLFIFPEGEADYTSDVLRPFSEGATRFALKTAEKYKESSEPVHIVPLGVQYRFPHDALPLLQETLQTLLQEVSESRQEPNAHDLHSVQSVWAGVQTLAQADLRFMESQYPSYTASENGSLEERLFALRNHLFQTLCQEHDPTLQSADINTEDLYKTKNRLRSLIAKKLYSARPAKIQQTQLFLEDIKGKGVVLPNWMMNKLEDYWIGIAYPDEPFEKRLKRLSDHLNTQLPYSLAGAQADAETRTRWQQQLNDCRRMKLLTLLAEDLSRYASQEPSLEALDDVMVKLEILLFSRFAYRRNKTATVHVGEPIDVKAFVAAHESSTKKEQLLKLTQTVQQAVSQLSDSKL